MVNCTLLLPQKKIGFSDVVPSKSSKTPESPSLGHALLVRNLYTLLLIIRIGSTLYTYGATFVSPVSTPQLPGVASPIIPMDSIGYARTCHSVTYFKF